MWFTAPFYGGVNGGPEGEVSSLQYLGEGAGFGEFPRLWGTRACLSPTQLAVTYLQGCSPREGLQGLQGLLGLSKDGLWLLGDRLQRKRPGR